MADEKTVIPPDSEELAKELESILASKTGKSSKELQEEADREERRMSEPRIDVTDPDLFGQAGATELDQAAAYDQQVTNVPEPDENEKADYLRAILNDTSYEKEETLFGGQLKLRFRTRTLEEQEAVTRAVRIAMLTGTIPDDNPVVQISLIQYFTLAFSWCGQNGQPVEYIKLVDGGFEGPHAPLKMPDQTDAAYKAMLREDVNYKVLMHRWSNVYRKLNQIKLHAIADAARRFEAHVARLASLASAENF